MNNKIEGRMSLFTKLCSPGPILRVNPDELSIHDPDFYNEVYVTQSKRRTESYDVFCLGLDFDG